MSHALKKNHDSSAGNETTYHMTLMKIRLKVARIFFRHPARANWGCRAQRSATVLPISPLGDMSGRSNLGAHPGPAHHS